MIQTLIVADLKNPLIAFCCFKVNHLNQHVDLEAERERKRQIEIDEALEKRRIRRQKALEKSEGRHTQVRELKKGIILLILVIFQKPPIK